MSLLEHYVRVTRQRPCPICAGTSWCLVDRGDDPEIAICPRTPSGRRMGRAGWYHLIGFQDDPHRAGGEVHTVTWIEDGEKREIEVRVTRWTRRGRDRLYVAELLTAGGVRDLGNYDLVERRWYTRGSLGDLSRERGEATKSLVERIVGRLIGGGF